MASSIHQQEWPNVAKAKGWGNVSAGGVSLNADLHGCVAPGWIDSEYFPKNVQGVFSDVPYDYSSSSDPHSPPECPPNVVYVPQRVRSSQEGFKKLHARCLQTGVALKLATVASTPNLQVAVILVAGYRQPPPQQQLQPAGAPAGAPAGSTASVHQQHQHQSGLRETGHQGAGNAAAGSDSRQAPEQQPQLFRSTSTTSSSFNVGAMQTPARSSWQQHAAGSDGGLPVSYSAAAREGLAAETAATARSAEASAAAAAEVAATVLGAGGGVAAAAGGSVLPPPPPGRLPLAAAAAAAATPHRPPAPTQCLYAYFVPLRPERDLGRGGTFNSLLRRRWNERRAKDKDSRDIIAVWKEDLRRLARDPSSGLPASEQLVDMNGYWDKSSSQYATTSGATPRMHCSLVQSVLRGHVFMYSARPWRPNPDGLVQDALEPDTADQQAAFLRECDCSEVHCGKLRAREELKRLREEGVQYRLEVRQAKLLLPNRGGYGELGVFAAEDIPLGTYVFEYVGEWLQDLHEPRRREALYEPAGLHFLYTLSQRWEPQGDVPRVVDATHLGNVSRFVNHRCEGANLVAINVCMGRLDVGHMSIAFRTTRAVAAGEELTVDYMAGKSRAEKDAIRADPRGSVRCRCGAAKCLGVVFPLEKNNLGGESRRNAAGTRRFPPAAAAAAATAAAAPASQTTTTPAASASSSDSGGASSDADAGAATAVAAGNLAEECPFGVGGPAATAATTAAAAVVATAEVAGEPERGRLAAAAAAGLGQLAAGEEPCCSSSVSGSSLHCRATGGTTAEEGALHRRAASVQQQQEMGLAAAGVSSRAQERRCVRAPGHSPGADTTAAEAAAAVESVAATGGARRLMSVSESPSRLKRQRLARPATPTEPPQPSGWDRSGGGGVAAAGAPTTIVPAAAAAATAVAAVGAAAANATAPMEHGARSAGGVPGVACTSSGCGSPGASDVGPTFGAAGGSGGGDWC
ncbi:hypothetical protein PLESTF_000884400 [Pleodorina starrii]|nr:hypothetical protein PLESTM_000939100 [Pleodorina starrii]GLC69823.1 hypothetical protein PLESTF_000884400 [Pleodorina starrii]